MPRKRAPIGVDDVSEMIPGTSVARWRGPVERAVTELVHSSGDTFGALDIVALATLRSAARNVDACERNGDRHTHTMAVARLSELLTKMRLEPTARGEGRSDGDDPWDRLAAELGTPSHRDPAES